MTYKATLTDERIAAWQKLMREEPDAIGEMMVKRPMFEKKKKRKDNSHEQG